MLLLSPEQFTPKKKLKIGLTYLIDKKETGFNEKLELLKIPDKLNSHLPSCDFEIFTKKQKAIGKKLNILLGEKECDFVIMIGSTELKNNTYTVRDNKGNVTTLKLKDLASHLNNNQ